MANYIDNCPGCGSTKNDIGWSAAYFDVYRCRGCGHEFCFKCRDSNNGRHCPKCDSENFSTCGRVSKG